MCMCEYLHVQGDLCCDELKVYLCMSVIIIILSGYFTSRPALKGYVRELNSLLQVCNQLEVLGTKKSIRTNAASAKTLRK